MGTKLLLAAAIAMATTSNASATVLDFSAVPSQAGAGAYVWDPVNEDGYTVKAANPLFRTHFWEIPSAQSIDPTGTALTNFTPFDATIVTRQDGGLFSLASIKLGEWDVSTDFSGFATVLFSFVDANGVTSTQNIQLDRSGSFVAQTFTFNTGPLLSFSFARQGGQGGSVQFDDIVVNAVPEPATWGMMLAGFAAVGFAVRRRRTSVSFA